MLDCSSTVFPNSIEDVASERLNMLNFEFANMMFGTKSEFFPYSIDTDYDLKVMEQKLRAFDAKATQLIATRFHDSAVEQERAWRQLKKENTPALKAGWFEDASTNEDIIAKIVFLYEKLYIKQDDDFWMKYHGKLIREPVEIFQAYSALLTCVIWAIMITGYALGIVSFEVIVIPELRHYSQRRVESYFSCPLRMFFEDGQFWRYQFAHRNLCQILYYVANIVNVLPYLVLGFNGLIITTTVVMGFAFLYAANMEDLYEARWNAWACLIVTIGAHVFGSFIVENEVYMRCFIYVFFTFNGIIFLIGKKLYDKYHIISTEVVCRALATSIVPCLLGLLSALFAELKYWFQVFRFGPTHRFPESHHFLNKKLLQAILDCSSTVFPNSMEDVASERLNMLNFEFANMMFGTKSEFFPYSIDTDYDLKVMEQKLRAFDAKATQLIATRFHDSAVEQERAWRQLKKENTPALKAEWFEDASTDEDILAKIISLYEKLYIEQDDDFWMKYHGKLIREPIEIFQAYWALLTCVMWISFLVNYSLGIVSFEVIVIPELRHYSQRRVESYFSCPLRVRNMSLQFPGAIIVF
ncbi:hypothetical protein QR680_006729 [Steinernema hermaphroditum]|uniref:Uncharacterized protein n=1 Tax=Steinernema hermaphroditum TaxID=289476 RepID=A0AA39LXK4_9BILA|nr:hypothetical protein QR680_006729 [Steinernema hermaphroditum]